MATTQELLLAKQTLSARLLMARVRGGRGLRAHTLSVDLAVASAGLNVHAVGVGSKLVKGKPTRTRCVRLYVVQKHAKSLVPPKDLLPENIDGIPTDVIESRPAQAFS